MREAGAVVIREEAIELQMYPLLLSLWNIPRPSKSLAPLSLVKLARSAKFHGGVVCWCDALGVFKAEKTNASQLSPAASPAI